MSKNAQSFVVYYNQFKNKIYNYFLYRTGLERDLAEDLTSEVFIKAFKNFDSFSETKYFQAWIFAIARNHLINHYKASKKIVSWERVEHMLISRPKDISQSLEIERIVKIIGAMDDNDKEPLLMRYLDGLSNKEIAEALNKDEGAVRTQISRGLAKLREILNA